ncbi:glycogen-binding domain-containing protein [Spirochaeta africana]|nr:glycogen-binding domain-containing protein [Spirochaeta africana]
MLRYSAAILLFSALAMPASLQALAVDDFAVHMQIMGLYEAQAPFVVSDHVILSFEPSRQDYSPRYVAAAFAHEDFRQMHVFARNQHGVFVLALPVPQNQDELVYRLRVDSIWMADPANPESRQDPAGRHLSQLRLPEPPEQLFGIPAVDAAGRLRLRYRGEPGQEVFVSGTFNNWDPFMHRARETSPGIYELELRVNPRQQHFYVFYVNGRRRTDPGNPEVAYGRNDRRVSAVAPPADRR